ncbi:PREDICTED: uncharacterized protein LOC106125528 isoform X2 [Papilio xuthus]|uniref:Uncharacterized protein LOC106125528 isoform X2 n=1 Tax=Papilio xuthus TaxID=66420 RepID=A0AAJ6ZS69_PAPXU|nr:PREDICTED: uncharacterized protein LOC106125528 isoform X2 [Papilio xuthus]
MSLTAILQLATAALCVAAQAAPPSSPHFFSATHRRHISPLDYYMDSPEMVNYYTLAQQKNVPSRAARLETLEPDSEVELVPGVQPPQQPLQPPQPPVAGNIPGLVPGQRVFIVHMPVPGYRPGTIGGYQPVYIVAAAPQGHYAGGYQNTLLVDPSMQVVSPLQLRAAPPAPVAPVAPAAQPEPPMLLGTPLGYNAVNFLYNSKNYRGAASAQGLAEQARSPAGAQPPVNNAPDKAVTGSEARRVGHKGGHKADHEAGHETGQSGSEETRESLEDARLRAEDASM